MTTFENIKTAEDLLNLLTERLDLSSHTVTFHIIDDDLMAGGLIDDQYDLYQSDAFDQIADDHPDDELIQIGEVVTYQIGNGESDSATEEELELFWNARYCCPRAWDSLLNEYADVLCSIQDIEIENPAYAPEEDDE